MECYNPHGLFMDPARWKRVEEIYQAASGRKPEERAAFVAEACAGEEELRREVESLLAQPSAGGLLDLATWEPAAGGKDMPSDAARPAVGQRVAHYEIQAKLGEGGMGAVYRAYDTQLRRPVALKILPPEYASDPERRSRLLREARAASALNHPNIVSIYEVGSDSGVDFFAISGSAACATSKTMSEGRLMAIATARDEKDGQRTNCPINLMGSLRPNAPESVRSARRAHAFPGFGASHGRELRSSAR